MFRNAMSESRLFGSRKASGTPSFRPAIEALEERTLLCNGIGMSVEASFVWSELQKQRGGQPCLLHRLHEQDVSKERTTRWGVYQDTQLRLFEIERDVIQNKAHTLDKVYQAWDEYLRP